jgi:hypothetical protein
VPDAEDYETASVSGEETTVIETRGNVVHAVTIEADASEMSGGSGTKPAHHLEWSADAAGPFLGLATAPATVVADLARGRHAAAAEVWYRMLLDYETDEPGTYTLAFTYTVVAQ